MLRLSFLYQASLLSFPELCQFWMEKKEFTVEIQILYGSSYFLIHERPFHVIPNDNIVKQHAFTCLESTIETIEQDGTPI